MNRFDIQNLRDLPIEKVAERLGLVVARHKALCPFHDDSHPSLTFNTVRNTYRCYACGAHGGPIDLAMFLLAKPESRSSKPASGLPTNTTSSLKVANQVDVMQDATMCRRQKGRLRGSMPSDMSVSSTIVILAQRLSTSSSTAVVLTLASSASAVSPPIATNRAYIGFRFPTMTLKAS